MAHLRVRGRVLGTELAAPPDTNSVAAELADLAREAAAHPGFDHIARFLTHAKALGLDTGDPGVVRRAIDAGVAAYAAEQRERPATIALRDNDSHAPVVYYMRFQDMVKIGTTVRILRRLAALMPHGLMAVEPGDVVLERKRHRQFSDHREHGEWFRLSDDIAAHVVFLRKQFEQANGFTTEEWLQELTRRRNLARRRPPARRRVSRRPAATKVVPLPGHTLPDDAADLLPTGLAAKLVGLSQPSFSKYRQRGKVQPVAQTADGRPLYRPSELIAVLVQPN